MVGDSGSPPFGTRGFICAVHGEAAEVMFDCDFVGAAICTACSRRSEARCCPLRSSSTCRTPPGAQLGAAAPDQVVADKKGKAIEVQGGVERGEQGRQQGRARRRRAPPEQADSPPSAQRPVPGSCKGQQGFEPGMGRGRGSACRARGRRRRSRRDRRPRRSARPEASPTTWRCSRCGGRQRQIQTPSPRRRRGAQGPPRHRRRPRYGCEREPHPGSRDVPGAARAARRWRARG